ncbi:MAG: hypothetical protein K1X75_10000 [Leptospirales bacterium]|nr:hypothetical protein [Leptospirales bacterium]
MANSAAYTRALQTLASGDFVRSQELFGHLVEESPEHSEYAAGFYASGWWNNRQEERASIKVGRTLADWLMRQWDEFDEAARQREYQSFPAYQAAMQAALRAAAENFRTAFQEESGGAVDVEMLRVLAVCLIRLEDYDDACDILLFALRRKGPDARLYFLLGEALLSKGDAGSRVRGLSYYRDAFYLDHRAIDVSIIAASPALESLQSALREKNEDWDIAVEWLPARLMSHAFAAGLRALSERELRSVHAEVERLESDLRVVIERYRDRVRARLCYLYLVLIQYYRLQELDRDAAEDFEDRLKSLSPESYDHYRSAQKSAG